MPGRTTTRLFFSHAPRWAGAANIFLGFLVMVSWHLHWQKILQLIPNTAPMQFNTALCFLGSGVALFLLTTPQIKYAPFLGGAVALLAFLTLLEYATGWNFHIDLLFFKPFFEAATAFPGRMSPLAAVCFVMIGLALMLSGSNRKRSYRWEIVGMFMCMVGIIAFVAVIGFSLGIVSAYGWGAYSSLALNTSIMFLIFSVGLLIFAWQKAEQANSNFVRWLPITGSVTLMAMVAIVAAGDLAKLRTATFWRKHTMQTIVGGQSLENNLIDLQKAMRGYITSGDMNQLASFQQAEDAAHEGLASLLTLTRDNPSQQNTLQKLQATLNSLLIYDARLIKLYKEQGSNAAFNADTDQQTRRYFGDAHDLLKAFSDSERELLDVRDVSEQADFRDTQRLLVSSCVLAVALLLLANFMASNQLAKRQLAEAKLERQAEALRRSNIELEQFAYVASHDMREPLRAVSGFAQILKLQGKTNLDQDANHIIDRIVDGAKRLSNIIDDLLALSSIGSKKKPFEKSGLEKPLLMAIENLSVVIKERNAVIRYDPLPALMMDVSQVTLLFQNLIANGIKFCAGRAPEIHIASKREGADMWVVSVRDNGIGIDPKYFGKLFGIFQRLHSRDDYPGTGIGLAICKRIVERHGGRIWLESEPGVGTTFHFTLADRQPEKYHGE